MKQKILSIILVLCICLPLTAQHRHEFSVNVGGGLSTLNYEPTFGKFTGGFGGEAGLGYHYFFSPNWGIGTGFNLALYNSETTASNAFFGRFNTTTSTGRAIQFAYAFNDYKEEISAMMLTIPLMVQYQTGGKIGFFASAGGKIGIPVSADNSYTTGTLNTSAYFPDWHVTYNDLPQYGFGTYNDGLSKENDLELNPAFMLSAELGAKFRFGNSMYLYVGAYLDYGLNDIRKNEGTNLAFAYDANATSYPAGFDIKGSLAEMSDKVSPLAIGGKIRVSFGSKAFDEVREIAPPAPIEPVIDEDALARERAAEEAARLAAEAKAKADAEARAAAEAAAREKAAQDARDNADRNALQAPIDGYTVSQVRLSKDQQGKLDEKIEILKRRPDWTVNIDGHTCDIGGNVVNERVGLARAEAAKKYMIEKGIDASRIVSLASKRDTQPVVSNTNESNRKINRRVVLVCEKCN